MIHDGSLQDRFIRIADHLASLIREHVVEPMGKLSNELFEKIHMREALVSREDLAQSRALLSRMLQDYARSGQLGDPSSIGGPPPPAGSSTEPQPALVASKPAGVGAGTGLGAKAAEHTHTLSSSSSLPATSTTTTIDHPATTITGGSGSGSGSGCAVSKIITNGSNVNGATTSPSPPLPSPSPSPPSSSSSLSSSVAGLGSAIGSASYGALTSSVNSVYDGVKVSYDAPLGPIPIYKPSSALLLIVP